MTKDPYDPRPNRPSVLGYDPTAAAGKQNRHKYVLTGVCTFIIHFILSFALIIAFTHRFRGVRAVFLAIPLSFCIISVIGLLLGRHNKGIKAGIVVAFTVGVLLSMSCCMFAGLL